MWLPSDGSLVTAVSPAIQKARVWTNKEYKDNSGLGQLDGFHPVVYCGSLVLFISLGGWRQAQEDVWPHWGCSGPQGKDDTVCVWQNSMVFTEVLSGSGVISVWTKAGGYHCNEDGFTCWASKQGRICPSASLLGLQYCLHFWHYCMTVSLYLSESALLSRKNWSWAVAQQWVVTVFWQGKENPAHQCQRTGGFSAFPD